MTKIVFDREGCVGAQECEALSPTIWKMEKDGRATLRSARFNPKTKKFELDIDDSQIKQQDLIVRSCPSGCIHVVKE